MRSNTAMASPTQPLATRSSPYSLREKETGEMEGGEETGEMEGGEEGKNRVDEPSRQRSAIKVPRMQDRGKGRGWGVKEGKRGRADLRTDRNGGMETGCGRWKSTCRCNDKMPHSREGEHLPHTPSPKAMMLVSNERS